MNTALGASPAALVRKATLIGLVAILLWATHMGLFRGISEVYGSYGGAALVFSVSAILSLGFLGFRIKKYTPVYLWVCGGLFAAYEICLSLALGLAQSREQSLELGMINYLWPSMTILYTVLTGRERASWLLAPAMLMCVVGIYMVMMGDGISSIDALWQNIRENPMAYSVALGAAFLWATYSIMSREYGQGQNAVHLFFVMTASIFWIQHSLSDEPSIQFHLQASLQVLCLGVVCAVAYACWNYGVQRGNLTLLAMASYFSPILAMLFGAAWLGFIPSSGAIYGVVLVTAGSILCWLSIRMKQQKGA